MILLALDISVWFFLALAGAWPLSSAGPCRDGSGESFSVPLFSPGMWRWWENSHPTETNGCQLLSGLRLALVPLAWLPRPALSQKRLPRKDFPINTSLLHRSFSPSPLAFSQLRFVILHTPASLSQRN